MSIKGIVANGLLVVASLTASVLVGELGARFFLDPADYLSVETIKDDILGIRITPGSRGFDKWGFRNKDVPQASNIVAIGDSHTYGNNATLAESWPSVVSQATGMTAYNLALGGYGPNQYLYLLEKHALSLHPRWVVCGLYMGDDFDNAFMMTYGLKYWSFLRKGEWSEVDADIWGHGSDDAKGLRDLRDWLSRNSILYRLIVHGPVLGTLKGALQIERASGGLDDSTTSLIVPSAAIQEAFRPIGIRDRLNLRNPKISEGMRITLEILKRMDRMSRQNGSRFVVVIIPTKETVFAEYLLRDRQLHLGGVIQELVSDEEAATAALTAFLEGVHVQYVSVLPALRREVSHQLYTRSDRDMHPSANGYRVIGDAVAGFLKSGSRPGS